MSASGIKQFNINIINADSINHHKNKDNMKKQNSPLQPFPGFQRTQTNKQGRNKQDTGGLFGLLSFVVRCTLSGGITKPKFRFRAQNQNI